MNIMEISKGIRLKIFLILSVMGVVPFAILVIVGGMKAVDELEESAKEVTSLRNSIVSAHVTELIEKNQAVLQSLAMSPNVIEFLQNPTDERREYVTKILHDTDEIFKDKNMTALTGVDGWQVIRTDGATLVNLTKRQHFQEAMRGIPYVSDIIASMSTGKMIVVVEEPVFNPDGKVVGMIQRNFNLAALQEFVQEFDDSETSVIIMDRLGRVIVNSDNVSGIGTEYAVDDRYKSIHERVYNTSGVINIDIDGEKVLATYVRNVNTGWMIVTIRPYHFIMDTVYARAKKALLFGLCIMVFGAALAYALTMRITDPIIEITNVVDKIADGDKSVEKLEIHRNDELGQMAAAFNKLRTERDTFQLESELDRLTELFNKKTMENLCRMKLKTFNENESSNIFMAFYIVDLDHFKEVNDLLGHQFGDKVLVEFAHGLKKIFRPNDCIGRFGGDEFVIIVDSLPSMEVVIRKAIQIKDIAYNLTVEGKSRFVTASIGIAIAPQNGRDYESLFAAADKAVYHVKNNGKNGYYCQLFEEDND